MMVEDKIVEAKAHHSIMLITGARNQLCCPECGSEEFYRQITYDRQNNIYDDNHVEEGYLVYSHSDDRCNECDYLNDR